ncbi:uncharacterized protein METZ01_LOCUS328610 [marine metagenome]|uniref:Uncharacterized protein n=1 Tax=marine metagenome TaxID=408172 RepID=A0A382PR91_9ZZZZ
MIALAIVRALRRLNKFSPNFVIYDVAIDSALY